MAHNATGRVERLCVRKDNCFIRLRSVPIEPLENYFQLPIGHANYGSLYALALACALNDLPLTVRTETDIIAGQQANIRYLVVDF
ncbi:hypothetical protein [Pseudonocardia adelaidensis]|uniref:Uncharacterized protein n=1 Tax=Pseudonocardia adelaidensis TaxID=648754 RepID=A0ABP9P8W0_9PSEU